MIEIFHDRQAGILLEKPAEIVTRQIKPLCNLVDSIDRPVVLVDVLQDIRYFAGRFRIGGAGLQGGQQFSQIEEAEAVILFFLFIP